MKTFIAARPVDSSQKDRDFAFVGDLMHVARLGGARVYGSLGMTAIDIVGKDEASKLLTEHPGLSSEDAQRAIWGARNRKQNGLNRSMTFALGSVGCFDAGLGRSMLGIAIEDDTDILLRNRLTIAQKSSDIVHEDVVLPDRELFLCIAAIDRFETEGIDVAMSYIASRKPHQASVGPVKTLAATVPS